MCLVYSVLPSMRLVPCATMNGSKPSRCQAAQHVDGRDVGVALGAAGVLAAGKDRRRSVAHLVFAQRVLAAQHAGAVGKAGGQVLGRVHVDPRSVDAGQSHRAPARASTSACAMALGGAVCGTWRAARLPVGGVHLVDELVARLACSAARALLSR